MILDFIVACEFCGHIAEEHAGMELSDPCEVAGCDCVSYSPDPEDYQQVAVGDVMSSRLTLAEAEVLVGSPAEEWVARCFEIASALAERVGGVAVYGCWDGPVDPGSVFGSHPSPNHGWVLLSDGSVFDPTRWVFEGLDPYLYEGPSDFYDEGRNRFRAENLPPFPAAGDDVEVIHLELPEAAAALLSERCGLDVSDGLTLPQWMWCANLPFEDLEPHAGDVYVAMSDAGHRAWIPIDNRFRVERAGVELAA